MSALRGQRCPVRGELKLVYASVSNWWCTYVKKSAVFVFVYCTDCLHHVTFPDTVCGENRRPLMPSHCSNNGQLIIMRWFMFTGFLHILYKNVRLVSVNCGLCGPTTHCGSDNRVFVDKWWWAETTTTFWAVRSATHIPHSADHTSQAVLTCLKVKSAMIIQFSLSNSVHFPYSVLTVYCKSLKCRDDLQSLDASRWWQHHTALWILLSSFLQCGITVWS